MPELPEVELICQNLRSVLGMRSWTIEDVTIKRGSYLPGDDVNLIRGNVIKEVQRRGKFVVFVLKEGFLVGHNAMSGYWDSADRPWTFDYVEGPRKASESDVRVSMRISPHGMDPPSERTLRFHDARLFGSLRFYPTDDIPSLKKLGPEVLMTWCKQPNAYVWGGDWLPFRRDKKKSLLKKTIKEILMDQEIVAGIGNIYAAEGLFRACIHPERKFGDLSLTQLHRVYDCVTGVMEEALKKNVDYSYLRVYRQGSCSWCGTDISCIKIKSRSTYFCPSCQPAVIG